MSRFARFAVPSLLVVALVAPGCAEAWDEEDSAAALTISAGDAAAVLDLVNYPGTSFTVLDAAAGLDTRAATNIVVHRAGADGVTLTADDNLFDDIAELDAVQYVGDAAFGKMIDFAHTHPAPTAESVESVLFHGWEAEAVVWGVNHSTLEEIDVGAALDARAANALVAARPFTSVSAMGPVAFVGAVALGALRDYADVWFAAMHDSSGTPALAGTFDGIAFDEPTAHVALDIANAATTAQLTAHGMYATGASAMVGGRPYTTLAAVAAVANVGTATMNALETYATSGTWAPSAPAGYVLDASNFAGMVQLIKEGMWEDEGFVGEVANLADHDDDLVILILQTLEARIDVLAAPLAGTSWTDYDAARDALDAATGEAKNNTRTQGWTYLATLGLSHP